MALRTIVKVGDPILRQKSRLVEAFDDRLHMFLDDLAETMAREQGAGLAAVQVGILRRIAVVKTGNTLYELINPVIVSAEGTVCDDEGCLSIPGERGEVERPKTVTVRASDRRGQLREYTVSDYTARAFCHEIDHLDGILFTDKVKTSSKKEKRKK